jgi:hypothetical protein
MLLEDFLDKMADITITGNQAYFNEDVKFFKDVYIYGTLYYDFESYPGILKFRDVSIKNLSVTGNSLFSGITTFANSVDFLAPVTFDEFTVRKKLSVLGISTFGGISTFYNDVYTQEDLFTKRLYVSEYLGVGTNNSVLNASNITGKVGIGSTEPEQKLDIIGSVKISQNIYDSANSPGENNYFLRRDEYGIRWVSITPSFTEGIYLQDEGVFIPVTGIAQSFSTINFSQKNSLGVGTDTIFATAANNDSPTGLATIFSQDFWGFNANQDIYRMTKVGIQNNNPTSTLDVTGTLHVTLGVEFDSTLDVDGSTTLNSTLDVDGSTTLNSTLDVTGITTLRNQLVVGGASSLANTLYVTGITTLRNQLVVGGASSLANTLDVTGITTLRNQLVVGGASSLANTLDVTGITTLRNQLVVGGASSLANTLDVTGVTTLRKTLQVGLSGTVITTTDNGFVGFGTNLPERDIEFKEKDVFFNGGAIYDTNENVGFRSEQYQVPRNVLTTVGVDTSGNIISGRFFDAANLIRLNLDFIASEAVGFITSIDYKNPAFVVVNSSGVPTNPINCKDDIKDILKSITYDITRGGNSRSVGAGLSYYNGNTLLHITGNDTNGYSVKSATIDAIQKAAEICKFVINNSYYPTSYQMSAINGTYADASRLILKNKDFIAAEAVQRTKNQYPSLTIPGGNQNCIDDIKLILDSIIYNLQFGGNDRVYDAARFYTLNPVLSGEEVESIYAYEQVKTIAIQIIRNENVTKDSGTINSFTQYKDLSVAPDPQSPTCQNQASAITSFVGIVTNAILSSTLPTRTNPTISIPISQIRDLTLQDDSARGSNTDPDGCANVVSSIYTCVGIVTTIINNGPGAAPNITYPDGKIVWAPAGADSRNLIYVSKYGNDDNNGRTEGAAKLTIGAAAAIAQPGDTIMVRSGVYAENNPIGLRTDVAVSGQDLRLVTIYPQNDDDVFYVRRGCLIENLSFAYSKDPYDDSAPISIKGAAVAFPPPVGGKVAKSGYLEPGPATEGPSGRWRSPYIRNCTNFMSGSIGMKIDGNHATAKTIGNDLKCMVLDSFTQYNEGGIGVSITNNGYAQLVSLFTICSDISVYCDSGGSCDLTNSNSSFGNYGLVAVGLGSTEYTGIVSTYPSTRTIPGVDAGSDTVTFANVRDSFSNPRRPFDGQALFFKINLNNYPDAQGTGIIQEPMVQIQEIKVLNGGSGFSPDSPPTVIVRDTSDLSEQPKGPQGIIAQLSPTVDESGKITTIDVVNTGRNYLSTQNLEVFIDGGDSVGAAATVITQPIYYTVDVATEVTPSGITTVTFNEFIPYELFGNEQVSFKRISRILTSSHSFEYIGTGVDINKSTPFQGAVPIKENEVVALDGAQIPFTSTDQKGNFDIGEGFQINQPSAIIRGRDFSKAIQAEVTPLILALR